MNQVIDEVLAGAPKYTITYNDNTTATGVSIDLETAVTTAGTPLNKALFDSIQSDLNTRLLISSKATTSQAQAGTNDTNYMTPSKTNTYTKSLHSSQTYNTTSTTATTVNTIADLSSINDNQIITVKGYIYPQTSSRHSTLTINGTGFSGEYNATSTTSTTRVYDFYREGTTKQCFELVFDGWARTVTGILHNQPNSSGTSQTVTILGTFDTLTSLTFRLGDTTGMTAEARFSVTYSNK